MGGALLIVLDICDSPPIDKISKNGQILSTKFAFPWYSRTRVSAARREPAQMLHLRGSCTYAGSTVTHNVCRFISKQHDLRTAL